MKAYRIAIFVSLLCFTVAAAADAVHLPQVNEANGVRITATLLPFSGNTWGIELSLESHSRPMDQDLLRIATLNANGSAYQPLVWEGAPPGGHHRKGTLRFRPVTPSPAALELQLRLPGESSPRRFQWSLKEAGIEK